jgi:hypothetical protein
VPLTLPSNLKPVGVSVAQGGRLIAVTYEEVNDQEVVRHVSHLGANIAGPFPAFRHIFLERDTVVIVRGTPTVSRVVTLKPYGGGAPITVEPTVLIFGPEQDTTTTFTGVLEFSPAGDWIAASVMRINGFPDGPGDEQAAPPDLGDDPVDDAVVVLDEIDPQSRVVV